MPHRCALVATLAVAGACAAPPGADDEPRRLYTMFDLQEALHEGRALPVGPTLPQGVSVDGFLARGADADTLKILPAFCEGAPAAYIVTDVWTNFDEVWVQPWYVLVTAWDDKSPRTNQLKDAAGKTTPPLFDVGPKSAFYSPYWLNIYAVVPPGTPSDKYTSTRQIFDDALPLHVGAPWVYTVRPANLGLGPTKPRHPILDVEVGVVSEQPAALIEGETMPYFQIGLNNFRYDAGLVVEEVPLFRFVRRDASGAGVPLGAPDVMGSGPPFARRAADDLGGQPRFGAFSRLTLAYVSATTAAFNPAAYPDTVARLAALAPPIDPRLYQGRVATNGRKVAATDVDCFAEPTFPASCRWLDSQERVEDALQRAGLEPTGVTATTPLVFYGKAAR